MRGDLNIVQRTIFVKARATPWGLSTLGKRLVKYGSQAVLSDADFDAYDELKRLRRENKILKDERDILKSEGL